MNRNAPSMSTVLGQCWKDMILTDIGYKLFAFIVFTPLFSILFRGLLYMGGSVVLSDVDIAMFFASPFGCLCIILLGAVWLGIVALEQSSMLALLVATSVGKRLGAIDAILFAIRRAIPVLRVAGRLTACSMVVISLFVFLAVLTYVWLLGEYDINFYLIERPNEFILAISVGVLIAIALVSVLLRLFTGWFLALPLVLFDHIHPRSALRESKRLTLGHRHRVLYWIIAWLLAVFALHTIVSMAIGGAGQLLIPHAVGSIAFLAGRIGMLLLLLTIAGLGVNVIGTIGFALILFHGYWKLNPNVSDVISQVLLTDRHGPLAPWRLTHIRMIAMSTIGALTAALVGFVTINSLRMEDRVQVMAHRGASRKAPENTLSSIRQAIQDGANWVEIDVQETADGEVVVIHDSDFMKLSKNALKVWDATLVDLREIDIGSWFDAKFVDERTAKLDDVLKLCRGKLGVIIELKYYGHDKMLEQRVVEIVERQNMARQVMIMSLRPEGVKKMKSLRPQWKCGILMSVSVGDLHRVEADFLAVNAQFATRSFIKRAHNSGKEVYVWTINDTPTMLRMMNRGVDGILTDRPELARAVLTHRSQMSNAERLLAEVAEIFGAVLSLR
ncbi:MAG TPA: glycerophosphodiester phosphodiesterase [Pirellula sp.]|nr:glycerophosphodiester phosphodiesterase [Pirellula sp.]